MREFFSQFGQVTRLKLSRSKKTGGSKGYAFIEFRHEEVAKVVAATMNNYLMFIRLLKCEFIPEEKVHPETFKGSNRKFSKPKSHLIAAKRHNSVKSEAKQAAINMRRLAKLEKTLKKLSEQGIDYSLDTSEFEQKAKPVPDFVQTPKGKLHVLKEDLSDAEVTFRTPPDAIKSSRLTTTPHFVKSPNKKKDRKGNGQAKTDQVVKSTGKTRAVKKVTVTAVGKIRKGAKRLRR